MSGLRDSSRGPVSFPALKALTHGLLVSVNAYAAGNPAFPHQSTAGQFFDEDPLEAYRALGHAIAGHWLAADVTAPPPSGG
ncbi:hypothetical protein [Novispirillum itersonii]|uniref:Uncharacterized protein n=1 Tax=Novispirillum itersonii TaxID=189 RepID=A0A7X0DLV7_NOVIT|nr:hypothetical protein [Novispirillum itersonii]MBB6210361.1 hypothetical protein [Novispirillum itersonii]